MKRGLDWKLLVKCIVIVYAIAYIGGIFTSSNTDSEWYSEIRPEITPPNWVFPIVWNILFFTIAISLYLSWKKSNKKQKNTLAWVFGINLVLNALWSVFYFGLKNPSLAFIELLFLLVSIASMIYFTNKINKLSSYLLVPYFLWVSFAGVLNYLSI